MSRQVAFTLPKLERLKAAYREAVEHKDKSFKFGGKEYLVSYARYLIEYLSAMLVPITNQHRKRG